MGVASCTTAGITFFFGGGGVFFFSTFGGETGFLDFFLGGVTDFTVVVTAFFRGGVFTKTLFVFFRENKVSTFGTADVASFLLLLFIFLFNMNKLLLI
jgi:hypothetical protein